MYTKKLIEKYYGEGVFFEDAINSLINDEMPDAIRESELVLVDTPKIEVVSADTENGVEYKAICILKPEVTVPEYKGLKAPKNVKDITEDDIKAQIEQIRQRNARIVSVDDRPAQKDDEVIIDFEGFMDGVAFDGGKADEFPLKLGSGQFIPGFEEQIEVVNKTLQDVCGGVSKPVIMVFNKIDAFTYTPKDPDDLSPATRENISLDEFRQTWMAKMENNCVFISAKEKINIEALKDMLYQKAKEIHTERFPYNDFLFQKYDQDYEPESTES